MHNMDWDDIRYFLAVCREGTATGAARVLGVNHTTVARRIGRLESDIGTRLFAHTRSGYEMSQAAENLYARALQMEEISHAIDREVFGRDAELHGPLKVTVAHDVAERLVMPHLHAFVDRYPCIDLELLTTTGLVDLAAREADIALRLTPRPPDYLVGREVLPLRHGVYVSPAYLKNKPTTHDVILYRSELDPPEWVQKHFPDARVAVRVDDVGVMATAVGNGLGLARMPCYIGDSDPGLRRLDLKLSPSTWGVWVLSHVDLRGTARVRVAREFLVKIIEQQRGLVLGEQSRYWDKRI